MLFSYALTCADSVFLWDDLIIFSPLCLLFVFRGIYRLSRENKSTEVDVIGEAVFARITDLKYIEKIGAFILISWIVLYILDAW